MTDDQENVGEMLGGVVRIPDERPEGEHLADRPESWVQVGIDVGKSNDPTVCVIDNPVQQWVGEVSHAGHVEPWNDCTGRCVPESRTRHDIRGVVTLPLGMPYPEQARRIVDLAASMLERPGISRVFAVVDSTGVGASLVDAIREELASRSMTSVQVNALVIGSGEPEQAKGDLHSTKSWAAAAALMTRLKTKAQSGRLRIAETPETVRLLDEILTLEFEVTGLGTLRFGAAGGRHDDRVYALALATVWEEPRTLTIGPQIRE